MIIIERENIGQNIKWLRERIGLTQEALAERLLKTQDYVSRIERGKSGKVVDLEVINEFAEALDCDVDDILKKRRRTMLKSIEKPPVKYYEAPEPWNKMNFYYEVVEEGKDDDKILELWLCRDNFGVKQSLFGLPFKQPHKTYTSEEMFEVVNANVSGVMGFKHIMFFCEDYCPEDIDKVYSLAAKYDLLEEDNDGCDCPFCNVENP